MNLKLFTFFLLFAQLSFSQTDSITFYYNKGEFKKAISYGELIISYYHDNKILKNEGFVNTLSWLATLSETANDSIRKEKYFKLLEENINISKNNNIFLIQNYYLIGRNYFLKKHFDLAKQYLEKSINLSELNSFEKGAYIYSLQLLGHIYTDEENKLLFSEKTKIIFEKQLFTAEKLYSKKSYDYAFALNNLGLYFEKKEDFEIAEKYFVESATILESIFGSEDERYIASIDNLTKFYINTNNLPKSDFFNQIGLIIVSKKFGKEHKLYLSFLLDKAIIKSQLGDYDNAFWLFDECFYLSKRIYGENSSYFSSVISNIGNFLYNKKEYKLAESYYLKDYEITKNRFGENHFEVAMCLNKLSNIYCSTKQNNKAIEINLNLLKILEDSIGLENNYYASICSSLGINYTLINDLKNAELFLLKSYKIKQKLKGRFNISNNSILSNIITFYNESRNNINQRKYILEYLELIKYNFIEMNENFGENDLISYTKKLLPNNTYFSILNFETNLNPEINTACFENELLLKNLSLRNQQRIKTTIEKSGDANIKDKYQQFIENKRHITKLDELPISERPNTYDQLKTDTENLEKELTRLSSTFADAKKSLSINWKQIQEKLKPNEVAIDLVSYNYYNKKWTDSLMYGAFVIKKDSKFPKYITLFEQKQLATLLERNNKSPDSIQAKILNKQYSDKTIGNLFYQPLELELKGCKTIYLAPSGLTHQINFKALPINDNQTFGEQFEINLVGSTASILDYKPTSFQEKKDLELILYGGIDYNKKSDEIKTDENKIGFNDLVLRSGISDFGYLKGTNEEVYKIVNNAKTFNYKTILKTEREATEESIKQLDGKTTPFVLHLATHGFFFENIKQEKQDDFILMEENTKRKIYKSSEDPMMRSGLIFAGANKYWGNTNEATETDDGILTAKEISNLDLSNCQLVVLSACETGLGQVNGSEGVFGLQRAFKMAGVKNIIMSLWKVPDAQTAELFESFYSECFSGKSIQEAFQSTQVKMKAKYSPFYWAGFVLLG